jgi:hypothetical protein
MNKSIKMALFGLALASAASFADDCTAPAAPTLPQGASATLEEMLAGQKAVKDYQAAVATYRACLDPKIAAAETAASGDSPGPELVEALNAINTEYNNSVTAEEEIATKFNAELKAYKEANPG